MCDTLTLYTEEGEPVRVQGVRIRGQLIEYFLDRDGRRINCEDETDGTFFYHDTHERLTLARPAAGV